MRLFYVYVGLVGISGLDVYAWAEKYITGHYRHIRKYVLSGPVILQRPNYLNNNTYKI